MNYDEDLNNIHAAHEKLKASVKKAHPIGSSIEWRHSGATQNGHVLGYRIHGIDVGLVAQNSHTGKQVKIRYLRSGQWYGAGPG